MQREREIEHKLINKTKFFGGMSYKWESPGADGVPDRIVVMPGGKIYFVELKTENGRLSSIQKYQIKKLENLGCRVYVIYGEEGLEEFLNEICSA